MILNKQQNHPLKGVVAYVDVQSSFGNPALAVKNGLEHLGAVVSHNLNSLVTHIVFRNGNQASRIWASRHKIHLVSPDWVKSSRILNRKAPESQFNTEQEKSVVPFTEICQKNVTVSGIPASKLCVSNDDAVLSDVPVFTRIRISQKFVRPSTPPEMKNFMLRLQKNQEHDEVNSIYSDFDDTIEKSSTNFTFFESPEHTEKKELSQNISTQEFSENPKQTQCFVCPSPITYPKVASTCSDSDFANKLLSEKENLKSSDTSRIASKNVHRLVQLEAISPLNELIIPISKRNSPSKTPVQRNFGHRKDQLVKKLSPSTPVTPDVLMNFVSSMRTIKSVKTNKGGFVSQTSAAKRSNKNCEMRIKPRKFSRTKIAKFDRKIRTCIDSSAKCIDSFNHTDKLTERFTNSKSISHTRASCLRTQFLKSNDLLLQMNNSNIKLKPICLLTENCTKDKVLTKKINRSKNQSNQDENSLSISSVHNSASTCLEKNVDLDCTPSSALSNRYQCLSVRSVFKVHQSTSKVLKTEKQNQPNETALQNPKRKSISQINVLNRRNSFDEFRTISLKSNRRKRNSVDTSVQTDDLKFKSIRILFSGTLQEEEITLITLLQTSSLKNYKIHHTSHSKNVDNNLHRMFNNSHHSAHVDKKFTHLVTVTPLRRTLKLFYAIMHKVHIVTVDWIRQSASTQTWLSETDFRPTGLPRTSRVQTIHNLFATIGSVYIASRTKPSRRDLSGLLTLGGACITNKQTEANFLIGHVLPNKICVQSTWILDIVQMVAGLTKNAIIRLNKNQISFIIKERAVYGGLSAWCDLEHTSLFPERICEGLSPEQDEIFLEVVVDNLLRCIRSVSSGASSLSSSLYSTTGSSTFQSSGIMNKSRSYVQTTITSMINGSLLGLKIKLVRRKVPCLAIELEQSSITGRSRSVWHFIPVQVVPPRLWDEFLEPPDPDFDVSIFFPPIKTTRPFVDRMKKFSKFIVISANGAGELNFSINVETLVSVKLTFRGLKSRSWMSNRSNLEDGDDHESKHIIRENDDEEPRSAVWGADRDIDLDTNGVIDRSNLRSIEELDKRFVSVSLDIKRISQLLASLRSPPSCFVCNIIHDHCAQFVFLLDDCKLKYNIPASNL